MKAATYTEYGPPSVLKVQEVARPVPKDNEVLVRVHAATVNRTDCAMLRAKPFIMRFFTGLRRPRNPIPGTEFAGQVEAMGKDVTAFKVGDRVFGFEDIGLSTQAQYLTLAEDRALTHIPKGTSYEQAAASSEGTHYAYNFINKISLVAGQKVLVNGATGAIGSAAVQLLKFYGARVTAVCATRNLELVKALGAERVIDYSREDFTQQDEKYHYVFDTVGKSSYGRCKPLLLPGGAYISSELGYGAQNIFLALVTPLAGATKVIFPIPSDYKKSIRLVRDLTEQGKYRAVIDSTYPLDQIAEAYRFVETGQKVGNVVVTMW
ncbi:NAD(P)-dependent alcohol dehydrogenase [Telluribacter sp.]|jgi:NADPH:quinone reductase-like Zn-dependent oxidoreductase|uniref:NAD(P)-dependent alcohol dehydrogenase n=1 Tax=Telluribacter sp. TaxID=1978767 RepID=UPI002E137250|nr:NAD(P)-dependent alcohol dehydrogenase [Telluribacter sp.]